MASNNAFQGGGPSGRNSRNGNNAQGGPNNAGGPGNNAGNVRGGAGVIGNFSEKKYGQGANQISKMGKTDIASERSIKNQKKNVSKDFRPSQVRDSYVIDT